MELKSSKILEEAEIPFNIVELSDRAVSVQDVIKYSKSKLKLEEICKTIVIKTGKGAKYAVFLRGIDRIDFNKLGKILGKVAIASVSEVKEVTGVDPGAVSPLTLKLPIIMDEKVLENDKINFGSGDPLYGIELKPEDLCKVINCHVSDVSKKKP